MKKVFLLFMAALGLAASVYAQDQYTRSALTYTIHPGTITTLDNKVQQGYIYNNGEKENQDKCIFYLDYKDGRSKKVYKPSELLSFTIENDTYKSIPYSGNLPFGKPDNHFLYQTQAGVISTYVYYGPEQQPVWQKGNDEPVSNAALLLNFKKNVLKLVGDNAELADKINRKEKGYTMLNVLQIINEYNAWAAAKK